MSVFVTMSVRPPDGAKFEVATKEHLARPRAKGLEMQFFGKKEDDPGTYILGGVWDSHESMHRYSDEVGEDFNARAGTEGVEWETQVYTILGTA